MAILRPDWPAPPRVHALVTLRSFGDMARGAPGRSSIRSELPADPLWMRQVHGIGVVQAETPSLKEEPEADAAVTRAASTVCAVTIADCMPVFLCDMEASVVAIAHAGWRGLCAGVIEAAFAQTAAPAGRTLAWLGPAIGPRVYEVGDEVREAFIAKDSEAQSAFASTRPGHWLLDLYAVARQRLRRCGVTQIFGGAFCTYTDQERFFSYRRDRTAQRMAALIWLS